MSFEEACSPQGLIPSCGLEASAVRGDPWRRVSRHLAARATSLPYGGRWRHRPGASSPMLSLANRRLDSLAVHLPTQSRMRHLSARSFSGQANIIASVAPF